MSSSSSSLWKQGVGLPWIALVTLGIACSAAVRDVDRRGYLGPSATSPGEEPTERHAAVPPKRLPGNAHARLIDAAGFQGAH